VLGELLGGVGEWRLKVMEDREMMTLFGSPGAMGYHRGGLSHGRIFV
jgi:hypothetical protein